MGNERDLGWMIARGFAPRRNGFMRRLAVGHNAAGGESEGGKLFVNVEIRQVLLCTVHESVGGRRII
jgi:hypothetical protein